MVAMFNEITIDFLVVMVILVTRVTNVRVGTLLPWLSEGTNVC
jgi:hypothetical protein